MPTPESDDPMKHLSCAVVLGALASMALSAPVQRLQTYCNPLNLDHAYYDFDGKPSPLPKMHSMADPLILTYCGEIRLTRNDLAFCGMDMRVRFEPGLFDFWVAPDSVSGYAKIDLGK